ncbi:hypothetical protein [uncultured Shewanella sp.]|uniref:hypothetical protein n=1 Tax=uncultured Shewanella sp. TaxID=173975 RepID=UPI00261B6329|nr:hypothetical protein [uncultured Shewanella sp.]
MKTLTHLSIFSVVFFSVAAFASTGNSSSNVSDTGQTGVQASLLNNTDVQGFDQSQQDRYRTTAAKSNYQFSNNMDSDDALASNQIASTTSFSQSQHDFSQPSSLL